MGTVKGPDNGLPDYSRCTVLIVDDDFDMRDMYVDVLTAMGFRRLLIACNGGEGFEVYKKHSDEIDLIILDKEMPGGDGKMFFHNFLKFNQGHKRRAKVLLSTGDFTSPDVQRLLAEGLDMAVVKPFPLEVFSKYIDDLLR